MMPLHSAQPDSATSKGHPTDPFEGTEYRALSVLGAGGMGEVYVVEHRALHMKYAAKLLRSAFVQDKRSVDRMRLEANALAKLEHENVVQIHAYEVTTDGLPFIVMDLLKGQTLRDTLVTHGPLELAQALRFGVQLLNGLDAVHQLGVIHRDIKPGNLFIHQTKDGRSVLKLLDFGVARVIPGISDDAPAPLALPTRTGTTVGTPMFMSPEAATGAPTDCRSDIYSAANILFAMIAGRGPFDELQTPGKILEAHVSRRPPLLSQFASTWLPPDLESIVQRGLAKDPNDRFQSAAEFGSAVYEVFAEYERARRENRLPVKEAVRSAGSESPDFSAYAQDGVETLPRRPRRSDSIPPYGVRMRQWGIFFLLLFATIAVGRFGILWIVR